MASNDKFLSLYKEYEGLLRDKGIDSKNYEDTKDDLMSGRLRICRQFRNYLSHQKDKRFIEVTDAQIAFISSTISSLKSEGDTVKKHAKSVKTFACTPSEKITNVLSTMTKHHLDRIVVINKNIPSVISIYDAIEAVLKTKTALIKEIKSDKKVNYIAADEDYSSLETGKTYVVTKTGSQEEAITSVLYM